MQPAATIVAIALALAGVIDQGRYNNVRVRDLPAKHNLNPEFSQSSNSRTGEGCRREKAEVNSPSIGKKRGGGARESDLRHDRSSSRFVL